jgi:hypothetical protein
MLYSGYQTSDTSCNTPVFYNAERNNYCYGYANTAHTRTYSSYTTFPNTYGYSDAYCQKLSSIGTFETTCYTEENYVDNSHFVFISNTVNPISSYVTFTSNITLTGLTTNYLTQQSEFAVVNATAASMKLLMSQVSFVGTNAAPTVAASAYVGIQSIHVKEEKKTVKTAVTTYSIVAVTKTSVSVSSTTTVNAVYTQYTNALTTAVTNQQFTAYLQSASKTYNAFSTLTATGSAVSNSAATTTSSFPNTASSSSSDDGLSDGAIAGIVIGSVVGAGLLIGLVYYLIFMMKPSTPMAAQSDVTMNVVAGDKA